MKLSHLFVAVMVVAQASFLDAAWSDWFGGSSSSSASMSAAPKKGCKRSQCAKPAHGSSKKHCKRGRCRAASRRSSNVLKEAAETKVAFADGLTEEANIKVNPRKKRGSKKTISTAVIVPVEPVSETTALSFDDAEKRLQHVIEARVRAESLII